MTRDLDALAGLDLLAAFENFTDMLVDALDFHTELGGRHTDSTMAQNDDLLQIV